MIRINWILHSKLTSVPEFRKVLIRFLEVRLRLDNENNSLKNVPLNRILNNEFYDSISASIRYIVFEHDENDKFLQLLIFLFLGYTQLRYPDYDSWILFCQGTIESQQVEISREVSKLWSQILQSHITDTYDYLG